MTVSLSLIHQHFLIYTIIPKTRETEFLRMCFRILKTDCGFQHRYILNFSKTKDTVAAKPEKTYMALLDKDNRDMGYVPKLVSTVTKFEKDTKELKGILTTLKETTIREDKHPFLEQEIF